MKVKVTGKNSSLISYLRLTNGLEGLVCDEKYGTSLSQEDAKYEAGKLKSGLLGMSHKIEVIEDGSEI